ncbi:MAG: alpha-E domain-containing protein [Halioglobus sp.]
MLSRVAERVYWLARYLERAEDTARLILVRHQSILDLPRALQPDWELLLEVLGAKEHFATLPGAATEANVIRYVFSEEDNHSSLVNSVKGARENMRTTREIMPSESWEQINSLYLSVVKRRSKGLPRDSRHTVLNNIIKSSQQITGMLSGTMSHDAAYQFLRMGRMLERADMISRIIDVGTADLIAGDEARLPYQNVLWISVLQSLSAYQMYRLSVRSNVNPSDVVDFLLHDEDFPRALVHSLRELESSMKLLPDNTRAIKVVRSLLRKLKPGSASEFGGMPTGVELHDLIDDLQLELQAIHSAIHDTWFSPAR